MSNLANINLSSDGSEAHIFLVRIPERSQTYRCIISKLIQIKVVKRRSNTLPLASDSVCPKAVVLLL